jgi:hypothetical protein
MCSVPTIKARAYVITTLRGIMRKRTWGLILLLVLCGALAPARAASSRGIKACDVPDPADRAAWEKYVREGWDSPFGLDYVFVLDRRFRDPALARQLGGFVGVRWVNFARVNWGEIEPKPPVGGKHAYHWEALDEGVRQWQQYGVHIMMSLRFVCPWANAKPTGEQFTYLGGLLSAIPRNAGDYVPKPEHEQDLRAFIAALVERYDGDGVNDMPGLRFPILHYQVCNEAYNELFWAGTVEQYGAHLKMVSQAARRACPQVKIILSGVCFKPMDGFYDREMDPRTKAYVDRLMPRTAPRMRPFLKRMDAFSRASLAFDYDILDARWSYYGVVAHCQEELRKAGRPRTEIWSAEMYSAVPLLDAMILPMTTLGPYPTPPRSLDYIRITRSPRDREFDAVNRWYRGLQSAMVVKNCLVGLDAGSRKFMNGWALDSQTPLAPYPLAVGGYKSTTFNQLWPAAYTYNLLIAKLDGITACRRVPMPEYLYVYDCTVRGGRTVLVAFCDDHIGRDHDQPMPEMDATIPMPTGPVRLTHIITDIGATQPETETLAVTGGHLKLRLSAYPVFLEPATKP